VGSASQGSRRDQGGRVALGGSGLAWALLEDARDYLRILLSFGLCIPHFCFDFASLAEVFGRMKEPEGFVREWGSEPCRGVVNVGTDRRMRYVHVLGDDGVLRA